MSGLARNEPIAYTIKNACALTDLSKTSIYSAIKEKKLPVRKYGSRTLILHDDLKAFVAGLPGGSR